jgi:hypothetical protein
MPVDQTIYISAAIVKSLAFTAALMELEFNKQIPSKLMGSIISFQLRKDG